MRPIIYEYLHTCINKLEFRESDVLPGKTEVKEGKFVKFISLAKVFLEKLINHET